MELVLPSVWLGGWLGIVFMPKARWWALWSAHPVVAELEEAAWRPGWYHSAPGPGRLPVASSRESARMSLKP
jgi:hypothetical protein